MCIIYIYDITVMCIYLFLSYSCLSSVSMWLHSGERHYRFNYHPRAGRCRWVAKKSSEWPVATMIFPTEIIPASTKITAKFPKQIGIFPLKSLRKSRHIPASPHGIFLPPSDLSICRVGRFCKAVQTWKMFTPKFSTWFSWLGQRLHLVSG